MNTFKIVLCACLFSLQISIAQNSKVFTGSSDSLSGFEEQAAAKAAISEHFTGSEFGVRMEQLKRMYINSKYGLIKNQEVKTSFDASLLLISPACTNEDLEASTAGQVFMPNTVNGWLISSGTNTNYPVNNSCNLNTFPNFPSNCYVVNTGTAGYTDGVIGTSYPIFSVFGSGSNNGNSINPNLPPMGGSKVMVINRDATPNYTMEKATKTFSVSASNSILQFAHMGVMNGGHPCCDASSYQVKLTNITTNSSIPCAGFSVTVPGVDCADPAPIQYYITGSSTPYTSQTLTTVYNKWKISTFDLTPYIGQVVSMDVVSTDCIGGAHYGHMYFDAQCLTLDMTINNMVISAVTNSINFVACGVNSVTMVAPNGLGPYAWQGPGTTTLQSTLSYSNQTFTTALAGTYTLTMDVFGSCAPITRTITLGLSPVSSTISVSGATAVCSNTTVALTASGVNTYTWSTGANTNTIMDSPVTNTLYVVSGTDLNGCISTVSVPVVIVTQPTLSVSGSASVCIGSMVVYTVTGANSTFFGSTPFSLYVSVQPSVTTVYTITGYNGTCMDLVTQTLVIDPNCSMVWPGDANYDGVVSNTDILEMGLHFTSSGNTRTPASILWQAWQCYNWVGTITNGKNLCHSDCNGDGVINSTDAGAVLANYNYTHTLKPSNENILPNEISIQADQAFVSNDQWGSASIYLGTASDPIDLHGVSFSLYFESDYMQFDSAYILFTPSFINSDLDFNHKVFPKELIHCARTRTTNIMVNGNGKVATFHFKMKQAIGVDTVVKLILSGANRSDITGMLTSMVCGTTFVVVKANDVGVEELNKANDASVFPNPSTGIVRVKSNFDLKRIEAYSVDGKLIRTEQTKGRTHVFDMSAEKEGVYILKLYGARSALTKKVSIIKR